MVVSPLLSFPEAFVEAQTVAQRVEKTQHSLTYLCREKGCGTYRNSGGNDHQGQSCIEGQELTRRVLPCARDISLLTVSHFSSHNSGRLEGP